MDMVFHFVMGFVAVHPVVAFVVGVLVADKVKGAVGMK